MIETRVRWRPSTALLAVALIALVPAIASLRIGASTSGGAGGVHTVSALLHDRATGKIGAEAVGLRGFWSAPTVSGSCAVPDLPPGDLELYCRDGEFGITELNEPILSIGADGRTAAAAGPHLTPWVPLELAGQLTLPPKKGQSYEPVPIVVVGHFDDERATLCREEARAACGERFVLEQIVSFEPHAVPAEPTPSVTLPPGGGEALFGADRCWGDVTYSFVGWTTTADLGVDVARSGIVYAMVAKDVLPVGDWIDDPEGSGLQFRWWGQGVCFAEAGQPKGKASLTFDVVHATGFKEWSDGRREPGVAP